MIDQWITPGWTDESKAKDNAVWTDDLIHFVTDSSLPVLNSILSSSPSQPSFHERLVRAGLEQRRARSDGRDAAIRDEGLSDAELLPYIVSTVSISTEVKRLLPEKGTKWLFMRATSRGLADSRMDYDIVLLDERGELIAVSQHVMVVVALERNLKGGKVTRSCRA